MVCLLAHFLVFLPRYSGPFLKPVSEKQAPGYKDVVKRSVREKRVLVSKGCIFSIAFPSLSLSTAYENVPL